MNNHGHYVGPVILASEHIEAEKTQTIEIVKGEVYKDIDLITHKHVDGNDTFSSPYNRKQILFSPQTQNARSSDTSEDVDGAVVTRYVDERDAEVRLFLQFCLQREDVETADDNLTLDSDKYVYVVRVPDEFNSAMLAPVAKYIHRYLVCGALADWFKQFGTMAQSAAYESQLEKLEESIVSALRGPSIEKRPLQPFGPAYRF